MKLLICYEMAHTKGLSVGDTYADVYCFTQQELEKIRNELRTACEDCIRADGLIPVGKLVFRSVTRLDS